ncbi:MAG: YggS family pyridoxal phosphate-dependent enzyme, partial [Cellulosimicrobium funkei]
MPLPEPSSMLPAQIAQNLARVRTRVDDAARAAGRAASDLRLLVATKTQPADAVRAVVEAGADLIGENRVQELVAKAPDLADLVAAGRVEVHMIGHL